MGAYTSIHCQELFVIPQFHRFDGKAPTAFSNAVSAHPAPSRKRPLFQPSGPPAVKLLLLSCSARTLAIRFRAPIKVVLHRLQQGPLSPSVLILLFA